MVNLFARIHAVQFFAGIVAFRVDGVPGATPEPVWNPQLDVSAADFRCQGGTHAVKVLWPDPFRQARVTVQGG